MPQWGQRIFWPAWEASNSMWPEQTLQTHLAVCSLFMEAREVVGQVDYAAFGFLGRSSAKESAPDREGYFVWRASISLISRA